MEREIESNNVAVGKEKKRLRLRERGIEEDFEEEKIKELCG